MSQDDLAAAAGLSTDLIRTLEQGRRHTCSIASLHRIGGALDVDLGGLLGRPAMPEAGPDAGVVALREAAVADIGDLLGDVEGEPLKARDAQASVTILWGTYWAGRWERLTGLIPQALIGARATLHASGPARRAQAAQQLAWCYSAAASTLAHLRQPDAAMTAARRARDLAADGDDPLLDAALTGSLAWQLLMRGRFGDARRVAARAADGIEPRGAAAPQALSVYGSLLLGAATAAARDGRIDVARAFLEQGRDVAQRLAADRMDYEIPFGPSQVTMQTVDVHVVTEDYPAALDAAKAMPTNPGLPVAARCRHLTDRACAYANLGNHEQALGLLLTAERLSPDWIGHQPLARSIVGDLLAAQRRRSTPLRQLAQRIGAHHR